MDLSTLTIKVEVSKGSSIHEACRCAADAANKTGLNVEFKFNEKPILATPGCKANDLVRGYMESFPE